MHRPSRRTTLVPKQHNHIDAQYCSKGKQALQ